MMLTPFFPTSKSATEAGITCGPDPAKPRASLEARVCIMHVSMRMALVVVVVTTPTWIGIAVAR